MGNKGVNSIKNEIKKRNLINSGTMHNSVTYKFTPKGVRFEVGPDYAKYVNEGVNKHRMIYLTKADKPIPLDVANRLFRWATPESIKKGAWHHPGFKKGKGFIRKAVKSMRKEISKEIRKIAKKVF